MYKRQHLAPHLHKSIFTCMDQVMHVYPHQWIAPATVDLPQCCIGTSLSSAMTWWWYDIIRPFSTCTLWLSLFLSPFPGPKSPWLQITKYLQLDSAKSGANYARRLLVGKRIISCQIIKYHIIPSCNVGLSIFWRHYDMRRHGNGMEIYFFIPS